MSKKSDYLKFFKDRNNLPLSYSFEINSQKPGKILFVSGAIHGNESAGLEGIQEFLELLKTSKIKLKEGRIIFILGNPVALIKNQRFIDSNLNRCFDLVSKKFKKNIGYEIKRATEIKSLINLIVPDMVLDLHSVSIGDNRVLIYHDLSLSKKFIKNSQIDTHFYFPTEVDGGYLTEYTSKLKIPSLTVECGNHNSKEAKNVALDHIISFCQDLNLIKITKNLEKIRPPDRKKIKLYQITQPIIPRPGFKFLDEENIHTGYELKKGQIYAISDDQDYISPDNLELLLPDKNPKPGDHDAGFLGFHEILKIN